jgi:hypothetical protein
MILILDGAIINTDNISVIKPAPGTASYLTYIYTQTPGVREGSVQPQPIEINMPFAQVAAQFARAAAHVNEGHELV